MASITSFFFWLFIIWGMPICARNEWLNWKYDIIKNKNIEIVTVWPICTLSLHFSLSQTPTCHCLKKEWKKKTFVATSAVISFKHKPIPKCCQDSYRIWCFPASESNSHSAVVPRGDKWSHSVITRLPHSSRSFCAPFHGIFCQCHRYNLRTALIIYYYCCAVQVKRAWQYSVDVGKMAKFSTPVTS